MAATIIYYFNNTSTRLLNFPGWLLFLQATVTTVFSVSLTTGCWCFLLCKKQLAARRSSFLLLLPLSTRALPPCKRLYRAPPAVGAPPTARRCIWWSLPTIARAAAEVSNHRGICAPPSIRPAGRTIRNRVKMIC